MRAQVHPNLSTERLVLPLERVVDGERVLETLVIGRNFTTVDLSDREVCRALGEYVGSHIRLHPEDVTELSRFGVGLNKSGRIATFEQLEAEAAAERKAIAEQEEAEARRLARKASPELGEIVPPEPAPDPLVERVAELEAALVAAREDADGRAAAHLEELGALATDRDAWKARAEAAEAAVSEPETEDGDEDDGGADATADGDDKKRRRKKKQS